MNGSLAIAKRELKTFFNSLIAYIVLGGFLVLSGWLFFPPLFVAGQASLRSFFAIVPWCFVVLVPAVTMRAIAEEKKSGTMELLLTMPMEDWQIVAGKFIAALGMVAVALAWTLPYPIAVASLAEAGMFDWGPVVAGYLGLLLVASAFIGLGLWCSALSRNQIVGFVVAFVLCIALMIVDKFAMLLPESLARVLEYVSVDYHFENIARGVLDTRDLLFYVSVTAIGLLLTTRTLSAARQ